MKKIVVIFCLLVFVIQFIQILYFERSAFVAKYDIEYWKDRYEHSQYQLPVSKRILGDDGVYAYIGHELINGVDPTTKDAQVPPVGKYLIGLSIVLFKNPVYYTFFVGLACIFVFYFISRHLLKDTVNSLFSTGLLWLDPLFFTQLWKSWIDLTQLFFLLLNIIFLIHIPKSKYKIFFAFISGFALGLFAETKIAVLLPGIFLLETIYFLLKKIKKEYIFFFFGICLSVLFSYTRYFLLEHSFLDFIKLQKYITLFWLQSKLEVHHDAIWQTLLFGRFPDVVSRSFSKVFEWWAIWPIFTLIGICFAIYFIFLKKSSVIWKGISFFLLFSLIIYTIIPAYPRYLLVVLPFLYLLGVKASNYFMKSWIKILFYFIIILYGLINATFLLIPKPNNILNDFYYSFSHQYFQDAYQETFIKESKKLMTREQFRLIAQGVLSDAGIMGLEIEELNKSIDRSGSVGKVKIKITYFTQDLGNFSEIKDFVIVKEDNKWKIDWNWNLLFNGFLPSYHIEVEKTIGKRGSILDSNGIVLAQDFEGILISVNPEKIDLKRENKMLSLISKFAHLHPSRIQNAYLENVVPGSFVPLTTPFGIISKADEKELISLPGVKLTHHKSRVYNKIDSLDLQNTIFNECCTRIYSSYNYHGIKGIEKEYDNVLWGYSGGKILMKDNKGYIVKVILEKDKKDGQDVVLK